MKDSFSSFFVMILGSLQSLKGEGEGDDEVNKFKEHILNMKYQSCLHMFYIHRGQTVPCFEAQGEVTQIIFQVQHIPRPSRSRSLSSWHS